MPLEMLENKSEPQKDILNLGGTLLEELAQLKTSLSMVDVAEVLEKWAAVFDEKFKSSINNCCQIKNPFDVDCNLPIAENEENNTEITGLDDGDLLNESLNVYEGDYLASLSPGKRHSLAQPATEFNKRTSFMPSNDTYAPFK